MKIAAAPQGYNYDVRGLYFFEVYPDGRVNHVKSDRSSIRDKSPDSLYGAYFRAVNGECILYFSSIHYEGNAEVQRIDCLDDLADSIGILRPDAHEHVIRARLSARDSGRGRYADIDIEFLCGCQLCSSNKRAIAAYLKEKYGWYVILNSINSEPLSKRTITVERNSIDHDNMPG